MKKIFGLCVCTLLIINACTIISFETSKNSSNTLLNNNTKASKTENWSVSYIPHKALGVSTLQTGGLALDKKKSILYFTVGQNTLKTIDLTNKKSAQVKVAPSVTNGGVSFDALLYNESKIYMLSFFYGIYTPSGLLHKHNLSATSTHTIYAMAYHDKKFYYILGDNNSNLYALYKQGDKPNTHIKIAGGKVVGHRVGAIEDASFGEVRGIAIDTDGTIYLSDATYHVILKITDKQVKILAGDPFTPGFIDGTGSNAQFKTPTAIALDNEYLYVIDSKNFLIRKINIKTKLVTTIAGNKIKRKRNGEHKTGTSASFTFSGKSGIVAHNNTLYVSDFDQIVEIQKRD